MNLKQQILSFRNNAYMGRYDQAIKSAKTVLFTLDALKQMDIPSTDQVINAIQQQYQKCINLKTCVENRILKQEPTKRWAKKKQQSNVQKIQQVEVKKWGKKEKNIESFTTIVQQFKELSNQQEQFYQKIQRELILPIRMPKNFKSKGVRILSVPNLHLKNVVNHLTTNGFYYQQIENIQSDVQIPILIIQKSLSKIDIIKTKFSHFKNAVILIEGQFYIK